MNPFVLFIVGMIILIVVGMAVALFISTKSQKQNRTMAVIKGKGYSDAKGESGLSEQDKRRADLAKKLKEQEEEEGKAKKKISMSLMLLQGGISISAKQFTINSAIFSVLLMLVSKFVFGQSLLIVICAGIVGFLGLPRFFLRWRIKRRQKKFLDEFADALEAMVRLLKAGMPVAEAISMAGREFVGPVGEEMSRIYDSQKIGIPLHEATLKCAERMPLTEVQMFATGIAIQTQTGASLSEVLTNLASVIRARYRLKRKVAALSAEAKASAMIIGALPFLVGGGLYAINPEYMDPLFDTTIGNALLAGSAFWMGLGVLSMKMMINFRV